MLGPDSYVPVKTGIDVLIAEDFRALRDARIALVANRTATSADGRRSTDILATNDELYLDRIFWAGEHAPAYPEDLPVIEVHPAARRIAAEDLHGLDALLIDVQEPGCRFSPCVDLLGQALAACCAANVLCYILDRPNPLDGLTVEGPSSEAGPAMPSAYPLPIRHGMSIGELARLLNQDAEDPAKLRVVGMAGWERQFLFEHTGLSWIPPLSGLTTPPTAASYAALQLLSDSNLSLGQGTDAPYELLGAPWIDATALSNELSAREIPGARFDPASFRARVDGREADCQGVRITIEQLQEFSPAHLALSLIEILRARHPRHWRYQGLAGLLARADLLEAIEDQADELDQLWVPDPDFFDARAKALIY